MLPPRTPIAASLGVTNSPDCPTVFREMLWLIRRQLKSGKHEVRRRAVERLARATQAQAIDCLALALNDTDAEIRGLAAAALSKSDHGTAVEPLLLCLNDRAPEVIKAALPGLRRFPHPRTPSAVAPLLRHPDSGVRGMAAQVLEQVGWRAANRDEEIWQLAATGQFAQAATFGLEALPAIELGLSAATYGARVAAVEALGRIAHPKALRPLLAALKSPDPGVAIAAIDALCRREDGEAATNILPALKHTHPQVRATAVEALGRLRAPIAFEHLNHLLEDPIWEVRKQTAEALGRLRDARALDGLGGLLERDPDSDVREAGAVALGSLGERQAIGRLVWALKDSTSGVRRLAAAALSRIDTNWSTSLEARAAAEKLKDGLKDKDPAVRQLIGQVLNSLGVTDFSLTPELEDADAATANAPDKRRKLAVGLLLSLLCDTDRDLRQAAAETLAEFGDDRAGPALMRARTDEDAGVRMAVELALHKLEAPGA